MPNRNSTLLAIVLIFAFAAVRPADAQLVGTDTVPGSSCAGFPDGATRVTADADLDGAEVTLVCDGTTWNAVSGGSGGPLSADLDLAGYNITGGGSTQLGYNAASCNNSRLGTVRYDSASKAFSICRDSAVGWEPIAGAGSGGVCNTTQTYTSPGTYSYMVPASFGTITIKLWGGGGGGAVSTFSAGGDGGGTTIVSRSLSAGGGKGTAISTGGAGGTASGGDINLAGQAGTSSGGKGGDAPGGGGGGGAGGGAGGTPPFGSDGAAPGRGGGGEANGGGGGSGAYVEKTYTPGTLIPGTLINDIVVGARGNRGDMGGGSVSGYGGAGSVSIICSTSGAPVPGADGEVAFFSGGNVYGSSNFTYGMPMNGLNVSRSATPGYAITGSATATSGVTYGVYGTTASSSGGGVSGVRGHASATTGPTNGVFGQSDSNSGWGVYGYTSATTGTTYGVRGESNSTGGIGVSGYVGRTTGFTRGVAGYVESTGGTGVMGTAAATTGFNYGVYGESASTAGRGVYGYATAGSGTNYGVYGESASATGFGLYCNSANTNGCGGNRNWFNASDARLKEHIVDLGPDSGLAAVVKLRPVRYAWRGTGNEGKVELGFIAQDVEKVLPELVGTGPDQEITLSDGSKITIEKAKVMSYGQVTVPLVKAVQELKAENDDLRATINELDQRLDRLEASVK